MVQTVKIQTEETEYCSTNKVCNEFSLIDVLKQNFKASTSNNTVKDEVIRNFVQGLFLGEQKYVKNFLTQVNQGQPITFDKVIQWAHVNNLIGAATSKMTCDEKTSLGTFIKNNTDGIFQVNDNEKLNKNTLQAFAEELINAGSGKTQSTIEIQAKELNGILITCKNLIKPNNIFSIFLKTKPKWSTDVEKNIELVNSRTDLDKDLKQKFFKDLTLFYLKNVEIPRPQQDVIDFSNLCLCCSNVDLNENEKKLFYQDIVKELLKDSDITKNKTLENNLPLFIDYAYPSIIEENEIPKNKQNKHSLGISLLTNIDNNGHDKHLNFVISTAVNLLDESKLDSVKQTLKDTKDLKFKNKILQNINDRKAPKK